VNLNIVGVYTSYKNENTSKNAKKQPIENQKTTKY